MKFTQQLSLGFIAIILLSTCKKEYMDMPQDQRLVYSTKASNVSFYDNYANDNTNSDLTAKLYMPEGAFNKEEVVMSFHTYNFKILNEELTKREYAQLSFIGGNENNAFVYFLAQEFRSSFIESAQKDFDVEFYFKGLTQTNNYYLYRIKIPAWCEKLQNSLLGAKGFTDEELYHIISGRINSNETVEVLGTGETNLVNWEWVEDAVIERTDDKAVAKFKTKQTNYVYCLASHILDFPVIKNVSIKQQGISIRSESGILIPSNPNSDLEYFVFATLETNPIQEYYFKKYKNAKKTGTEDKYKFIGRYSSSSVPLPLQILDDIHNRHPEDTITRMTLTNNNEIEVLVSSLIYNYSKDGKLIKNEVVLPPEVKANLELKFNWYDEVLNTEAVYNNKNEPTYTATFKSGTKLVMDKDYNYIEITNPNLVKIYEFASLVRFNLNKIAGAEEPVASITPFIDAGNEIKYLVEMDNKAELVFDYLANFLQMFQLQIRINTVPINIIHKVLAAYGKLPNEEFCYRNYSVGGDIFYQLTLMDETVVVYKDIKAGTYIPIYEKVYEQEAFFLFPEAVYNGMLREFGELSQREMAYYVVDGNSTLEVMFAQNENNTNKIHTGLFSLEGELIGYSKFMDVQSAEPEIQKMVQKVAVLAPNAQMTELRRIEINYKVTKVYFRATIINAANETKDVLFTGSGNYINGL